MNPPSLNRRQFVSAGAGLLLAGRLSGQERSSATYEASAGPTGAAPSESVALPAGSRLPMRMKAGHQYDHSPATLRLLAAYGVDHICSGLPSHRFDDHWSVDGLLRLRRHVESFGIRLASVPLPMKSSPIAHADLPDILLGRDPGRDRAIGEVCQMIRNAGAAGIPMVQYNLTFLGVVRTGRVPDRGGASYSTFDYAESNPDGPLTEAGKVDPDLYWERIEYFLKRVVPAAEEAKVRLALHPQDPGLPPDRPYRGVYAVLSSVDGLKRFVDTVPSPYHGLNFCQGTVSEMLPRPGEQIYDVIRYFGSRRKIFNVHFRNIRGGFLHFTETFPDNGSVDMPRALRTYQEVGYDGMVMPDHVPEVAGDPDKSRAFSYCFGYIQALLQVLRTEAG